MKLRVHLRRVARLVQFVLSPVPWALGVLQHVQFILVGGIALGLSQVNRVNAVDDVLREVPGGVTTLILGYIAVLLTIALYRLAYRLDGRTSLNEVSDGLHKVIQNGRTIQNKLTERAADQNVMALIVEATNWSLFEARSFVYKHFSSAEASLLENSIGFKAADQNITLAKLEAGIESYLFHLYGLQKRIAARIEGISVI